MQSVELFAGAGGLGLGVCRGGFKPVAVVEWDRYCCDTIRENAERGHGLVANWPLVPGDVREFDFRPFEDKVEFVSGGPPCQPFSMGGKHRGHRDGRDMFPEAVRAIREIRPRAFLFENVKGLTRNTFRNYFEYIRLQMEHPEILSASGEGWFEHLARLEREHTSLSHGGLRYRVVTRVLNAANYGVPQRRERVFFVGFRDDLEIEWNFPDPTHSIEALLWEQAKEGKYWERHRIPKKLRKLNDRMLARANKLDERPREDPWRTVRDALEGLPDPEKEPRAAARFSNHLFQPGARSYKGHTGSPLDEPAKTLKAGVHGVPGGENMLLRPNMEVRYFSVRESARLQTFPDDFLFHGSWSETMRQLGNAVPVSLAELLARDIRCHLEAMKGSDAAR
jgi:DNA (cytosine-5)-methyltransferase 1